MAVSQATRDTSALGRAGFAVPAAWLAFVALDFLGHGVVLARYWDRTAAYWRPDEELFRLIPVAYGSFFVYCGFLVWVLMRACPSPPGEVRGALVGAVLGLVFGAVAWLGAFTVLPMPLSAVLVWTLWGTLESAGAGLAAAYVLAPGPRVRRTAVVAVGAAGSLVVGIVLQNLFGLR